MTPQEALVSLLIASARADGSVSVHEANSIEHLVGGMQLFRGYQTEGLQKVFAAAAERVKQEGAPGVVQAAAAVIPRDLGPTAFALAVDLMLSDGRLSAKEDAFATELRALLHVDANRAAAIIDVLQTKNAG